MKEGRKKEQGEKLIRKVKDEGEEERKTKERNNKKKKK